MFNKEESISGSTIRKKLTKLDNWINLYKIPGKRKYEKRF